ncbi:hypothetical protein [Methylocapsa aurea]|uniref:hypothetical protein n=1 Tax=Methylocapsa aurea TaxID=663610 RepID=UPI000566BEB1|nr:hypothetical protein [Methylocapsa aurea]
MFKLAEIASLSAAFICGFVGLVFGQTSAPYPPMQPPVVFYALPGDAGVPTPLYEGRSVYRMWDPGAFYSGSDESGYQTGNPQNPRTGE